MLNEQDKQAWRDFIDCMIEKYNPFKEKKKMPSKVENYERLVRLLWKCLSHLETLEQDITYAPYLRRLVKEIRKELK